MAYPRDTVPWVSGGARMRAAAAIVILSFTAPVAATPDVTERDLRQAIAYAERGLSALEKGNTARARESFAKSFQKFQAWPEGHLGLGHIAMKDRKFEDALAEYRQAEDGYRSMGALRLEMENARYARSRDELQHLRSELIQYEQQSSRNQTLGSADPEANMERICTQLQNRIRQLESMPPPSSDSVKAPPAEIYFFIGNALFNLKRMDEAIAVWEASVKLDDHLPLVQNNLAVAYWTKGRLEDARAAMLRAEALGFQVNPNFRADLNRALVDKP